MPESGSARIFISYARSDGERAATALRERLAREEPEITVWQDRAEMEGGVAWWRQIARALESVQFLVLVATPAALHSPIARKEWQYARQLGVCVYPVVPSDMTTDFGNLPKWMRKTHFFNLEKEWQTFVRYLKSPCQRHRIPFMPPDLPTTFVSRPDLSEPLIDALLKSDNDTIALTTSLQGAGGLGKTTLAAAVCYDERVLEAFDDGILWVTLGQDAKPINEFSKIYTALTGTRVAFVDDDDAEYQVARLLEDKRCLLVIDDVWHMRHLTPFLRGGRQSVRLLTTRIGDIAKETTRIKVDEMSEAQADAMLTARLPEPSDFRAVRALSRRLGEWPLLLKLVNGQIRRRTEMGDTVTGAFDYVSRKLDRLGIVAFDVRDAAQRDEAIARSIGASLEMLSPLEQQLCHMLAVFPEDEDIPADVVAVFWDVDQFSAEESAQLLDDVALVTFSPQRRTLRLHDVIRGYLATRVRDLPAQHSRLADVLGSQTVSHLRYAWAWRGYHLLNGNRLDDLRKLLLDVDWLIGKLTAIDAADLVREFELIPGPSDLDHIRDAIRLSSYVVVNAPRELPGQLLARLPRQRGSGAVETFIQRLSQWRAAPWLEPMKALLNPAGGPLVAVLTGHESPVTRLALTDYDARLVSGAADGTVGVWDWRHGRLEHRLGKSGAPLLELVVPRSTDLAIVASGDATVSLWNVATGDRATELTIGPSVSALAAADGYPPRFVVATGEQLKWWTMRQGNAVNEATDRVDATINALAALAANSVAAGCDDGTVRVWPDDGGKPRIVFQHDFPVETVAYLGTDHALISLDRGGTVLMHHLQFSPPTSTIFTNGAYYARTIAAASRTRRLVTAGDDFRLSVWDLDSRALVGELAGHFASVNALCMSVDGRFAMSASDDHSIRVWDLQNTGVAQERPPHSGAVRFVGLSPDQKYGFSASEAAELIVWSISSVAPLTSVSGDRTWRCHLPDGESYILVRLPGGRLLSVTPAHEGDRGVITNRAGVRGVHWNIDEAHTLVIDAVGCSELVERPTRRSCWRRRLFAAPAKCVDVAAQGTRVGIVTAPDAIEVLSPAGARSYQSASPIRSFAIAVDEQHFACGTELGEVELTAIDTGRSVYRSRVHSGAVSAIDLSNDGMLIVSGGEDRRVRLLRRGQQEPICSFTLESAVTSVALSRDRSIVVAGDEGGHVHFFRTHIP